MLEKPIKRKSKAELDRELVRLHSTYVRLRDADDNGNCRCITCPMVLPWKQMQAGHWQDRRKLGTRFHDKNVNAQCEHCNEFLGGRFNLYQQAIEYKYDIETVKLLEKLANDRGFRITYGEYLIRIEHYKNEIVKLKKKKITQ